MEDEEEEDEMAAGGPAVRPPRPSWAPSLEGTVDEGDSAYGTAYQNQFQAPEGGATAAVPVR